MRRVVSVVGMAADVCALLLPCLLLAVVVTLPWVWSWSIA